MPPPPPPRPGKLSPPPPPWPRTVLRLRLERRVLRIFVTPSRCSVSATVSRRRSLGPGGAIRACIPRMPTAPAPISGPRSPRRVGVIRAWRLYGSRACVLSSSWAALKNVAANPSATPPPTTTSSRSSRLHSDATARPTRRPGALHDLVRRLGRRAPGDRLDRQARRLGLEAAAGAAAAAPAVGLDDDVADVAGVGRRPVEQLAVEHDAAADAGRHGQHAVVRRGPWPRPASPRPGPAPCRRGRRRRAWPVSSASRPRSGNSRHAGMLTGETVSQCRVIGPAEPTPTHADAHAVALGLRRAAARRCRRAP